MKDFAIKLLASSVRWLIAVFVAVGSAYFTVEAWVDGKVEAAEQRVMQIRSIDINHLDKRFDTIERLIKEGRN